MSYAVLLHACKKENPCSSKYYLVFFPNLPFCSPLRVLLLVFVFTKPLLSRAQRILPSLASVSLSAVRYFNGRYVHRRSRDHVHQWPAIYLVTPLFLSFEPDISRLKIVPGKTPSIFAFCYLHFLTALAILRTMDACVLDRSSCVVLDMWGVPVGMEAALNLDT